MSSFGTLLRKTREQRGLSPADLARKTGVSRTAVSRHESGELTPKRVTIESYAKALGINPTELLKAAGYTQVVPHEPERPHQRHVVNEGDTVVMLGYEVVADEDMAQLFAILRRAKENQPQNE